MQHILITGANRGIGLEFCRHYLSEGHRVTATVRNPSSVSELQKLSESNPDFAVEVLDISEQASIAALAKKLNGTPINLLINNAGAYGPKGYNFKDIDYAEWATVMQINVLGTVAITEALLDNLRASTEPSTVAFLSSKMGSMADNGSGGSYIYRSSKAALNACVKSLSIDLAPQVNVVALHPGWVQTDMGGPNALITTRESVSGMTRVIADLNEDTSGHFIDFRGHQIPW